MEPLNGKTAIVTGASSGIGEAIARAFVILGIHVIGLARREERLKEIAESLKGSEGSFDPFRTDLRYEGNITKAFAYTKEKYEGVDILVNAAGVTFIEPITNGSTEHFREIFKVNTLAPAITMKKAVESMRERGKPGHIIKIVSVVGINAILRLFPDSLYPASKYALRAMIENIIQEITENKDPIKVTGIYPGLVKTKIFAKGGGDEEDIYKSPHLQPEDIADAVAYTLKTPDNVQDQ